ncbi:MAG: hypothetical protein AAGH83_05870 [Pseudomonadota bacterium]
MTFTEFKDRIWGSYDWTARNVAKLPPPLARAIFGIVGVIMWIIWFVPRNPLRRTLRDLAQVSGKASPLGLCRRFISKFTHALWLMERLRAGHSEETDRLLHIPDEDRLTAHCASTGAILVMPHTHASLLMARGLGQRFPLLLLVRTARNDDRAVRQQEYYDAMGCEVLDVRRSDEVAVARAVLRTLRGKGLVMGAVDLLGKPPKVDVEKRNDQVRLNVLTSQAGAAGWPARFGGKAGAPILAAMPVLERDRLILNLSPDIAATEIPQTTQAWMNALLSLILKDPADWVFALDRHWAAALGKAAAENVSVSDIPEYA